ncbi:MAG: macro domain-containing protein [Bacteroidales bacterium]
MAIKVITGNIFTTECHTIVNTINCVGVMGAGIALECRLRYPKMFQRYVELCDSKLIDIGKLWIYKTDNKWILNFPTKKHWKFPSKKEYLHAGLKKFIDTYSQKGIRSIAFPLIGSDKGGIPADESLKIMESYLKNAIIDVEIYKYDPNAKDDLYEKTKKWLLAKEMEVLTELTGIKRNYLCKVINAMNSDEITQLNQLARIKGVGIKTIEKVFIAANTERGSDARLSLFDF